MAHIVLTQYNGLSSAVALRTRVPYCWEISGLERWRPVDNDTHRWRWFNANDTSKKSGSGNKSAVILRINPDDSKKKKVILCKSRA